MQQIYGRKVCEKLGKTREKTKTRGEFTQQKKHKKKGKYIVFTDPENADWRQGMGKDMKK